MNKWPIYKSGYVEHMQNYTAIFLPSVPQVVFFGLNSRLCYIADVLLCMTEFWFVHMSHDSWPHDELQLSVLSYQMQLK